MTRSEFTLADFMEMMERVSSMGLTGKLLAPVPGMRGMMKELRFAEPQLIRQTQRMRAMYDSMSPAELEEPELVGPSRRQRIAGGSGVRPREVAQFLRQFEQSRGKMRAVGEMDKSKLLSAPVTSNKITLDPQLLTRSRLMWILGWVAMAVATVLLLKQVAEPVGWVGRGH